MIICGNFFEVGKIKMCRSPPTPPPAHQLFQDLRDFRGSAAVARHFAPLSKHPGAALEEGYIICYAKRDLLIIKNLNSNILELLTRVSMHDMKGVSLFLILTLHCEWLTHWRRFDFAITYISQDEVYQGLVFKGQRLVPLSLYHEYWPFLNYE